MLFVFLFDICLFSTKYNHSQKEDSNVRYYLDKDYLLDGQKPPINFVCFGCGSRDHYVNDCPKRNNCLRCGESGREDDSVLNSQGFFPYQTLRILFLFQVIRVTRVP